MEAYDKEKELWNEVYSAEKPVDLRNIPLTVEPGFDECLKDFGQVTHRVLDFGCGTGDIIFQYIQNFPEKKGVGIDEAEEGISFAKETAKLSQYKNLHFFTGDIDTLSCFETAEFDGIILSNVLDVMPEQVDEKLLTEINRILCPGGYLFVKLNPYYKNTELQEMSYKKDDGHLYEKDGILRLHQETTEHWKRIFTRYGAIVRYVEFQYPWQEGLNRLFLIKKSGNKYS